MIQSCSLEGYYRLLRRDGRQAAAPRAAARAYAEFDDPTFHRLYCRALPGGLVQTDLVLEGVHCAACVWLVERLPRIAPGVAEARLDLRRSSVTVTFDPSVITLSRVARVLHTLGYAPHPARGAGVRAARRAEDRRMLVRLAVAGACAGNIMLLYFALYAGMFEGIEASHEQLLRWASMLLNTLCLAWPGLVFARSAIGALRTRTISLDVPIAMGLYLGGAWGIYKTLAGAGDLYFDSISALVFFLLIGRFVQQRQQRAASDALELLFALSPVVAHRVDEHGTVADVAAASLRNGEVVDVHAGEAFPADGVVTAGESRADVSMLTGESRPVAVRPGDTVAAGAVNLASVLRVRVDAVGEHTRIGRLMRLVEDASRRRARIVMLADTWGAWLLYALLALAAVTLVLWWGRSPSLALDRAAALLIATCPCGLGLATPLAMTAAIGRAARRGLLVKGGDALQSLASPGPSATIVLDKTGTITLGHLAVVQWVGDHHARVAAATLAAASLHPVASALARDTRVAGAVLVADSVRECAGRGMTGEVHGSYGERASVAIGSRAHMAACGASVPAALDAAACSMASAGLTPVFVALDERCVAVGGLGDPVRPDAREAIQAMTRAGWEVRILSGDHPDVVASVARQVGVPMDRARGGATPEDKCEAVRTLAQTGRTVMVGDGVNDAGALAAATVGIAVRGGAEASLSAADVSLRRDGLAPVLELLAGARHTMRAIHLTIATSLAYNVLAASLAITGYISPLLAAIIMPASSLTVVAICLRSRAFRTGEGARPGVPS